MSKRALNLGAAFATAMALAAGQAGAATLTGFTGTATTSFSASDSTAPGSDTLKNWLLGGSVAGPLSDLPNLNFQFDASYDHNWADDFSAEVWNLGGSAFWANANGRIGVNVNYSTIANFGHATNFGAFGEWYFGNVTGMAKAGWITTGGAPGGDQGTYFGTAITAYFIPNLAVSGGVQWLDVKSGGSTNALDVAAEFLLSENTGIAGFAGYTHVSDSFDSENIWRIGLRWYGTGGTLQTRQRNGTLNPWLPALGSLGR